MDGSALPGSQLDKSASILVTFLAKGGVKLSRLGRSTWAGFSVVVGGINYVWKFELSAGVGRW